MTGLPVQPAVPAHFQTFLAFDFGLKRTGVATGNRMLRSATPQATIKAEGDARFVQVAQRIKEWQPDALVVGLPLNMDGSPSEMSERAEKFARRLHGRYQLPVHTHDERLTTYAAKGERMAQGHHSSSYRDNPVDALAAALLLEGWLTAYNEAIP